MQNFHMFSLDKKIQKGLEEIGFIEPTPIQMQAIPKALEGADIFASAQTGTGKTAAFLLPALQMLINQPRAKICGPRVLILVPTRELAMQVAKEAERYGKHLTSIKTIAIYGGVPYFAQKKSLSRGYDILVATPGRLIDYMERKSINLSQVQLFVLDEADRMLDMGFIGFVDKIASAMSENRQTFLFSATLDKKIMAISQKYQKNPQRIHVEPTELLKTKIEKQLYFTDNIKHKTTLLENLLKEPSIEQAIIFTSTIHQANILAENLQQKGFLAGALHGNLNQRQRTKTIDKLRHGNIHFLVATDIAARGIDIPTISHVINFDLPRHPEDFIHRIGRTGRAGAKGTAITFASYKEELLLAKIEKLTGNTMPIHTISGLEPKTSRVFPIGQKKMKMSKPSRHHHGTKRFNTKSSRTVNHQNTGNKQNHSKGLTKHIHR